MRCVGLQFVDPRATNDVMFGTHLHLNKWHGDQMCQRHLEAMRSVSSSPGLPCGEQHQVRTWAPVSASILRLSSVFLTPLVRWPSLSICDGGKEEVCFTAVLGWVSTSLVCLLGLGLDHQC